MAARPRPSEAEWAVYCVAISLATLHALDDAFLHRQPGVPLSQHGWAALVTILVVAGGTTAFRVTRPGLRAGIAAGLGSLALTNGVMHVIAVGRHGPSGSDATGLAAAAAGLALVLLGATIPHLHRHEAARSRRRRWRNRIVAVGAAVLLAPVTVIPAAVAITQTHMPRRSIADRPSEAYRDVTFTARDGLTLSGWYAPSRNGAAIVLVSSSGGDRNGSIAHAEVLAEYGYGVLLYDARGSGRSDGSPNGYGWGWDRDVAGALDFLERQPDVEAGRIGGLGLSTGADVLLAMAGDERRLGAIVSDGATARSYVDLPARASLDKPTLWLMFHGVRLLSGSRPGPALEELVRDVSPTPLLLIAAGSIPVERSLNQAYAEAAREPVELWDLPDVHHTAAIRQVPEEYRRRVVGHFDRALLGGRG